MSGHLVHFAAPTADRTPCGLAPAETPCVRHVPALLSRAANACAVCLAHVRDPGPAEHIARVERYRAAVAKPRGAELHYMRDYERTLCGGPVHGASRVTGDSRVWADEPEASRCQACTREGAGRPS